MEIKSCVGIDIGYGFTKIYRDGDPYRFPTAVSEFNRETTFSDLRLVRVNGNGYIVGEQAEREGNNVRTRTTGFVASPAWIAVLSHALNKAGYTSGDIILGVPPKDFTKAYRQQIIDSMKGSRIFIGDMDNPYKFNGNVRIIPQGAGIFFRHIRDNQGDFKKNVVVIDVGHFTVDFTYFSEGKYVESAAESEEMGMSKLLDEICDRFYHVNNRTRIGHREALLLLKNDELKYLGNTYRLAEKAGLVESYGRRLADMIDEYFRKLSLKPDIGIIGGGGGMFLKGFLEADHSFALVDNPEFANAMGYWIFGMQAK